MYELNYINESTHDDKRKLLSCVLKVQEHLIKYYIQRTRQSISWYESLTSKNLSKIQKLMSNKSVLNEFNKDYTIDKTYNMALVNALKEIDKGHGKLTHHVPETYFDEVFLVENMTEENINKFLKKYAYTECMTDELGLPKSTEEFGEQYLPYKECPKELKKSISWIHKS